jgi:hypothetical protein
MNKFLFTLTDFTGQTWTTLGQLRDALLDSQSQPVRMSVVTPLALRCSALDPCSTRVPHFLVLFYISLDEMAY